MMKREPLAQVHTQSGLESEARSPDSKPRHSLLFLQLPLPAFHIPLHFRQVGAAGVLAIDSLPLIMWNKHLGNSGVHMRNYKVH